MNDHSIALTVKALYIHYGLKDPLAFERSRILSNRTANILHGLPRPIAERRYSGQTTFKIMLAIAYAKHNCSMNYQTAYLHSKLWARGLIAEYCEYDHTLTNRILVTDRNQNVVDKRFDIIIEDLDE